MRIEEFFSKTSKIIERSIYAPVNINPRTPSPGALVGDSQHYVSLLVNQVISKANEAYSPLCPGAGGAGMYIDWCIIPFKNFLS